MRMALSIIRSGLLAKYGIRRVGISGYPEGHPDIGNDKLWLAMRDKKIAIEERGHDFAVVTQFSFDAEPVLTWLEEVRKAGAQATVRVGVPRTCQAVKRSARLRRPLRRRRGLNQGAVGVRHLDHEAALDRRSG